MKVCIVGCGGVFDYHFPDLRGYDIEHFHFVDINGENLKKAEMQAEHYGLTYSSSIEIPDEIFDVAIVQTPSGDHIRTATKFIEKSIPVLIEKPLALSWEDLNYIENAENCGEWIMGGFNCRFIPAVKAILTEAKKYKVLHAYAYKNRSRPDKYYTGWHGTWEYDGGVMNQQGIHCVDLICALTNDLPMEISYMGFNNRHEIQCEDTGTLIIKFPSFTGVAASTTAPFRGGTAGLRVTTIDSVIACDGGNFNKVVSGDLKLEKGNIWDALFHSLKNKLPSPLPVSEAIKASRVMHAAYVSMESNGEWVPYGTKHNKLGLRNETI